MEPKYIIPTKARIGHVHLKVSNLKRSLEFYCDLLGFELTTMYGNDAAFVSAGGYHHHIGLNTWFSKNAPPAPKHSVGLFTSMTRMAMELNYIVTDLKSNGVTWKMGR